MKALSYLITSTIILIEWTQSASDPLDERNINLRIDDGPEPPGHRTSDQLQAPPGQPQPLPGQSPPASDYGGKKKDGGNKKYRFNNYASYKYGRNKKGSQDIPEDCKCGVRNTGDVEKIGMKIVNGPVTKENEYPWQVAIWHKYEEILWCGGSLISSETVLTAAHCVLEYDYLTYVRSRSVDEFRVIVGAHDVRGRVKNYQWIKIKEILVQEDWIRQKSFDNDFALLTLAERVTWSMNTVRPICLPPSQKPSASYENITAIVTGWGRTLSPSLWEPATFLRQATVNTVSEKYCKQTKTPGNRTTSNMICAIGAGEWPCVGDSGGPLIAEESGTNNQSYYSLIGVVSFSFRYVNGTLDANNQPIEYCRETEDEPGVYARVTAQLKWIKKNMQGTTCPHP